MPPFASLETWSSERSKVSYQGYTAVSGRIWQTCEVPTSKDSSEVRSMKRFANSITIHHPSVNDDDKDTFPGMTLIAKPLTSLTFWLLQTMLACTLDSEISQMLPLPLSHLVPRITHEPGLRSHLNLCPQRCQVTQLRERKCRI